MSYQEKKSLASIVSTVLGFGIYYWIVMRWYHEAPMDTTEEFRFWGAAVLILIPVQIAFAIVIQILFVIGNTVATRELEKDIRDEFGKLIELRAIRNAYIVVTAGIMLAMVAVVFRMPPAAMFKILLWAFPAGSVMLGLTEIYFYRKGI